MHARSAERIRPTGIAGRPREISFCSREGLKKISERDLLIELGVADGDSGLIGEDGRQFLYWCR